MTANSNFRFHKNRKSQTQYKRSLHLEALEERALLSVSPAGDYQDLAAAYSNFQIAEDANFIDVTDLTVENLQAAIDQAAQTAEDDVVVVHTTAADNTIQLNGSALVIDIDSDLYGSLTVVGYGDSMLTLFNTQENIALVYSGEVNFGSISFQVLEPAGQSFQTDNLVVVSEGAKVAYDRSMSVIEERTIVTTDPIIADVPVVSNNEVMQAPSEVEHTYKGKFKLDGNKWAYVAGLSLSDFNQLQTWTFNGDISGNFIDAEKDHGNDDDDLMCWAGAAANVLWYTGWAKKDENGDTPFANEDAVFQHFVDNFTNVGATQDSTFYSVAWFLSGVYYPSIFDPYNDEIPQLKPNADGGGFHTDVDLETIGGFCSVTGSDWSNMSTMADLFKNDYGIGLQLERTDGELGHAVTAWGYVYDESYSTTSQSYYQGVLITDSDNDQDTVSTSIKAPNTLTYIKLTWDRSKKYYKLPMDYYDGEYYLDSFAFLAPMEPVSGQLDAPSLNVSSTSSTSVSVTVGNVANAESYKLQYSTNSSFTNATTRTVQAGTTPINNLTANQTYYFRVQAIGSGNYTDSNYSEYQSVTLGAPALATPTLSVSVTDSTSVSVTVGSVANASGYTLQYSTNSNFTNATTKTVLAGSSTISGLSSGTTYYFRVMATGSGSYSNSNYSATRSVFLDSDNPVSEIDRLRTFLEQADARGQKNGRKIDVGYDANDTSTWSGVTFKTIDGETRVTRISWVNEELVGTLDVSGFTALTFMLCGNLQLAGLNVSGCTALDFLSCDNNNLTTLDVSTNTALTSLDCRCNQLTSLNVSLNTALRVLNCESNQLTSLDVSENTKLSLLCCESNKLTSLDLSNNSELGSLYCWNSNLEYVIIDPDVEALDICFGSGWTFKDGNGTTLAVEKTTYTTKYFYTSNNPVAFPIRATNSAKHQTITFLNSSAAVLDSPALSVSAAGTTSVSVTVGNVANASGYTLQYSTNSNFASATTKTVKAGTMAISGLKTGTTYYFRVRATASGGYINSAYSETETVTTDFIKLSTPTFSVRATGDNSVSLTIDKVANASGLLLEYSTNSDFTDASTQTLSSAKVTNLVNIIGLDSQTTYYFRVMAIGSGKYSNSDFSITKSATTIDEDDGAVVTVIGKKVYVIWADNNPMPDAVRYRVATGSAKWTTKKLKAGVTEFSFNAKVGTNYEIQVLLDQQETNILQTTAVVLDQPKLKADKKEIKDDTFQVSVTNYAAKNLAANVTQAIVTVNGAQTEVDIQNQQGEAELTNGGYVTFNNGLFTFTEMNSNTAYKVQVTFSDGQSFSTPSSTLSVKTIKTCYQTPTLIYATAISDTEIDIAWTSVYGKNSITKAQTYTIQYSLNGKKWTNATTKATGNIFTIQKLKGGNEYRIRVFATKDKQFEASAVSNDLPAETLALPKTALDKKSMTSSSFNLNVTNYYGTNLKEAPMLNIVSDKFGSATINLQHGTGSGSFDYSGMTVTFAYGTLTFTNVPVGIQQKLQINASDGVCTTAWSKAVSVKTK